MPYPNRELSQFASFLTINDTNANLGITSSSSLPYVGLGTDVPTEKLEVNGNIKANGIVSAVSYYGDGSTLSNVTAVITGSFVSTNNGFYTTTRLGVGTTSLAETLNVGGTLGVTSTITAYSISLTAPNGIAPIQVQSNTLVSNLNADLLRGRTPPSGNFVGDTDTQTLSNKTLTLPVISSIQVSNGSLIVPNTAGTLIHTGASNIITSSLYGTGSITNTHISNTAAIGYSKLSLSNSITNSDVASNANISYSKLNLASSIRSSDIDPNNKIGNDKLQNSTISGISLGSNLATLTRGSYINGNNYNGSTATTWSVNATSANTASAIVARDENGVINVSNVLMNGVPPPKILLETAKTATGNAVEFTNIPSWVKRITLMVYNVSSNTTNNVFLIQLGHSGSSTYTTSNYSSSYAQSNAAQFSQFYSSGFGLCGILAAQSSYGSAIINTLGNNIWVNHSSLHIVEPGGLVITNAAGGVTLAGTLDKIRIIQTITASNFDSGTFNVLYEG